MTITADASKDGIRCALLQNQKPVHYASHSLTPSETCMAQIQKELLAIVFATQKFRHYIYGTTVTVETDHQPLVTILKKPICEAPASLQKMILKLQGFDLKLVYKRTTQMPISDTLSRAYIPVSGSPDEDEYDVLSVTNVTQTKTKEICQATMEDSTLQTLINFINNGWPNHRHDVPKSIRGYFPLRHELVCDNRIIYKANRIVISESMCKNILQQLHSPHVGVEATLRRAKECAFWDTINKDIENWVETCAICAAHKPYQQKQPLKSFPVPQLPWDVVGIDLFEWHGKDYLVTVDSYSGWFEIDELHALKSSSIINKLKPHFSKFGIPATLHSDSAPNLTSQEFKDFCRDCTQNQQPRISPIQFSGITGSQKSKVL